MLNTNKAYVFVEIAIWTSLGPIQHAGTEASAQRTPLANEQGVALASGLVRAGHTEGTGRGGEGPKCVARSLIARGPMGLPQCPSEILTLLHPHPK